jgi:hypothetical protein
MNVTCAVSGPFTQSSALTVGKSDCWVGPAVGRGLTTVQPSGMGGPAIWVGSGTITAVGAFATEVGT